MTRSKFDQVWTQSGAASTPPAHVRGKSSHPDYRKMIVYVPKRLHRAVKIACLHQEPPIDMSELVAQQLIAWLKNHTENTKVFKGIS